MLLAAIFAFGRKHFEQLALVTRVKNSFQEMGSSSHLSKPTFQNEVCTVRFTPESYNRLSRNAVVVQQVRWMDDETLVIAQASTAGQHLLNVDLKDAGWSKVHHANAALVWQATCSHIIWRQSLCNSNPCRIYSRSSTRTNCRFRYGSKPVYDRSLGVPALPGPVRWLVYHFKISTQTYKYFHCQWNFWIDKPS